MPRPSISALSSLVALAFAAGALAQQPPPAGVDVVRIGHAVVSGAPRVHDVESAFDQQVDSLRSCAAGSLGAINGAMEVRLVVHGDGTVTDATVAVRPTGAAGGFVLCVTGVLRRIRLPSFRAHDAAVTIRAMVHAPAATHH